MKHILVDVVIGIGAMIVIVGVAGVWFSFKEGLFDYAEINDAEPPTEGGAR